MSIRQFITGVTTLLVFFSTNTQILSQDPRVTQITANLNQLYHNQVTSSTPLTYHYPKTSTGGQAVRVSVSSVEATEADPILVIIKRQRSVLSWQIPLVLEEKFLYNTTSRTLCPMDNFLGKPGNSDNTFRVLNGEQFYIEIITLSSLPVRFTLRADRYPVFQQQGVGSFLLQASPAEPTYIQYTMREGANRVLIKLRSDNHTGGSLCSFLSIQSVRCPVGDLDADLRLDGRYQTITTNGAIEVSRTQFGASFYIVVLVKPHDTDCEDAQGMFTLLRTRTGGGGMVSQKNRVKTVNITMVDSLNENGYVVATMVPVATFLVFFVLSAALLQTGCCGWRAILCGDLKRIVLPTRADSWGVGRFFEKSVTGRSIPCIWESTNYKKSHILSMMRKLRVESRSRMDSTSEQSLTILPNDSHAVLDTIISQDESSTDAPYSTVTRVVDVTSIVDIVTAGTDDTPHHPGECTLLRMADINRISSKKLTQTATEYSCTLMAIFLFYSLPVLQLVLTHQALLVVTGNEDICYYNFSCANRLGIISDFNHIISNMGYVVLGVLFLLMVRRRAVFTAKLRQQVWDIDDYGIPSQLGLFYGMGLALVMEGIMSACYHVCPSYNNFQFDTSFMYLITGLLILKLYHSRHPDVLPKSYIAYMLFAGFIFVALVGVVSKHQVYWIVFSVIHGVATLWVGLQIFFVGYLELTVRTFLANVKTFKCAGVPWSRIVLSWLITIINMFFVVIGPFLRPYDFATHLLFILQANLMVYAAFYVVMKIIDGEERISRATCFYFLLATPAWIVGMYYFTQALSNWEVSAAVSREGNRECFFFNFYDEHDVWHMLSAFGLFFTFMMLLTLDDDLATVSRDKISVF